jgi:hypothetical protein
MKDIKFEKARFFDPDSGENKFITPYEFNKKIHHERLECPCPNCSASLSFVAGFLRNASNTPVQSHFKTNQSGEPHAPDCELVPEVQMTRVNSMAEALQRNDYILLNVNFSTSYIREKGQLKARFARAAMEPLGGDYRPDWIKAHKDSYSRYAGHSVHKILSDIRALREAARKIERPYEEIADKIRVSYLHAVIPWSSFYLRDTDSNASLSGSLNPQSIFEILHQEMQDKHRPTRLWNAAPALRAKLSLTNGARQSNSASLYTKIKNEVQVDGRTFALQDVIYATDPDIRRTLQCTPDFSLVATPFIERFAVQNALNGKTNYIHLNWPICRREQLFIR